MDNPIHSVSIAEFDVDKGNTLSIMYPSDAFDHCLLSLNYLADKSLPDGAHMYEEDYCVFRFSLDEFFKEIPTNKSEKHVFGLALFQSRRTDKVKRGAIQKSLVLFTYQPMFDVYIPLMRAAMSRYLDKEDPLILKEFYQIISKGFSRGDVGLTLWDERFSLSLPVLGPDQFGTASLKSLVMRFGESTMYLWYGLLLRKRVLFVGTPASEVTNCCLAAPLLVSPLHGFTDYLCPYICFGDMDKVTSGKPYIFGTTNRLFEERKEFSDMIGSFESGRVVLGPTEEGLKIGVHDRQHIRTVINGINDYSKSEKWVRDQFESFTSRFLHSFEDLQTMHLHHRKQLGQFFKDPRFSAFYKETMQKRAESEVSSSKNALKLLSQLKDSLEKDSLSVLEKRKLVYEINQLLEDVEVIEDVCQEGGVPVLAMLLTDTSAQIRKYAASALAAVAISQRGQIALISSTNCIPAIVSLLDDAMPNVVNAASYCMMKIAEWYTGTEAILRSENGITRLMNAVVKSDGDVVYRTRAATTLQRIYQNRPDLDRPNEIVVSELLEQVSSMQSHGDVDLVKALLLLLDQWNIDIEMCVKPPMNILETVSEFQKNHSVGTALLPRLVSDRLTVIHCVGCGVVEVLLEFIRKFNDSYQLLSLVAETNFGCRKILQSNGIDVCLAALMDFDNSPLSSMLANLRFLGVSCQKDSLATSFVKSNGIGIIKLLLQVTTPREWFSAISMECVHVLAHLFVTRPDCALDIEDALGAASSHFVTSRRPGRRPRSRLSIFLGLDGPVGEMMEDGGGYERSTSSGHLSLRSSFEDPKSQQSHQQSSSIEEFLVVIPSGEGSSGPEATAADSGDVLLSIPPIAPETSGTKDEEKERSSKENDGESGAPSVDHAAQEESEPAVLVRKSSMRHRHEHRGQKNSILLSKELSAIFMRRKLKESDPESDDKEDHVEKCQDSSKVVEEPKPFPPDSDLTSVKSRVKMFEHQAHKTEETTTPSPKKKRVMKSGSVGKDEHLSGSVPVAGGKDKEHGMDGVSGGEHQHQPRPCEDGELETRDEVVETVKDGHDDAIRSGDVLKKEKVHDDVVVATVGDVGDVGDGRDVRGGRDGDDNEVMMINRMHGLSLPSAVDADAWVKEEETLEDEDEEGLSKVESMDLIGEPWEASLPDVEMLHYAQKRMDAQKQKKYRRVLFRLHLTIRRHRIMKSGLDLPRP
eukprot:TRINITY_DN28093_c0_g1_i1.p1 TRINITY_DN28093_c0_g1~~TRINITY_DN28093_c0_g1_i1.p1  ORF type:complete len:1238 (-),score=362.35 TRINITY_DN28093_c0_g1_i1:136-3747(-)